MLDWLKHKAKMSSFPLLKSLRLALNINTFQVSRSKHILLFFFNIYSLSLFLSSLPAFLLPSLSLTQASLCVHIHISHLLLNGPHMLSVDTRVRILLSKSSLCFSQAV